MTVISNPLLLKKKAAAGGGGDSAYQIERSLRFNNADDARLQRSVGTEGNRRTWTFSTWIKRLKTGAKQVIFNANASGGWDGGLEFSSDSYLQFYAGEDSATKFVTNRVFRDPTAWYHITVTYDSTNSVADDRLRLYINGVRETSFSTYSAGTQNLEGSWNRVVTHYISAWNAGSHAYSQLADTHHIDGLALSPAAFGSFDSTGVWNPKAFALPAPNNGRTWSSNTANLTNPANAFDGSVGAGSTKASSGAGQVSITFNPPLTNVVEFEHNSHNGGNHMWAFNGGTLTEDSGGSASTGYWRTPPSGMKIPSTINSFQVRYGPADDDASVELAGIRVNGVVLVDGQTDPTTRNNPNDGTEWSESRTGDNSWHGSDLPARAFDGQNVGPVEANAGNNYTFTFNGGISNVDTIDLDIKVNGSIGTDGDLKVNGTSIFNAAKAAVGDGVNGWYQVPAATHGGNLNSLYGGHDSGGANVKIYGVKVNGNYLIDNAVDNSFHLKFNDTSTTAALGGDSLSTKTIRKPGGDVNADDDKDDLVLAIPGDTIVDVHHTIKGSGSAKSLTNTNCTTSTTTSHFYGTSTHLNGTNAKLTTTTDSSDFDISGGTFTFECWFMSGESTSTSKTIITTKETGGGTGALELGINQNKLFCYSGDNQIMTTTQSTATVSALTTDKWHHLAVTRDGTTWRWFVDGELAHSNATSVSGSSDGCFLGYASTAGGSPSTRYLKANFQDIRFYKGTAKYTGSFGPPTRNDFTVTNLSCLQSSVTNHSNDLTSTTGDFNSDGGPELAFDGNTATQARKNTIGAQLVWEPSTPIHVETSLEYYQDSTWSGTDHAYINGVDKGNMSDGSTGWKNLNFTGTLKKFEIGKDSSNGNGNSHPCINALRLNGDTIITDSTALTGVDWEGNDSLTDSPTNYGTDSGGGTVRGNYCTWNPLMIGDSTTQTFSQGNLEWKNDGADAWTGGTLGVRAGSSTTDKWYWEIEVKHGKGGYGICNYNNKDGDHTSWGGGTDRARIYLSSNGKLSNPAGGSDLTYGSNTTCVVGDIVGVALDLSPGGTSGKITFYKNGTSLGVAHTDIDTTRYWTIFANDYGENPVGGVLNAGQRAFKYTPPTDHKCLCTGNFTDTFDGEAAGTVNNPSKFFDVKTYTGNGSTNYVKDVGFQPELIWVKSRSNTYDHLLFDKIRSDDGNIYDYLKTNTNDQQSTGGTTALTAYNSDGFTMGADGAMNTDGATFVSWMWDAGTSFSNSSGTNGASVASEGSYNATAGFAIVKYTGGGYAADTGVYHPLAAVPNLIIHKRTDGTSNWEVYTTEVDGSYDQLTLNTSDDKADSSQTAPTNTLFNSTWSSGQESITYLWTAIPGYSAFGSYTGNNSDAGPFVYTGFQPSLVIVKTTNTTGNWVMYDNARGPTNPNPYVLLADTNGGGSTHEAWVGSYPIDMLSNGFKLRGNTGEMNGTNTFIYMAWAEHPLKTARAR